MSTGMRYTIRLLLSLFIISICSNLAAQVYGPSGKTAVKRDSATAAANAGFSNGKLGEFFMGLHYRPKWVTPVIAPIFNVNTFKGGLTTPKSGGGFQTKTLRLQDSSGIQYNLRTIDKFPGKGLPNAFKSSWVSKTLKDKIDTAHPYVFLAMPVIDEAIGVYHTKPQVVYVPKDASLGDYAKTYGGKPFMIEIRSDEDLSGFHRFGNSENIAGSGKMYEHLHEENDNEVDPMSFARARLFDMVIGDWDKHNDQWRWTEYEKEGKDSVFRPVPRNRDQIFVTMDGVTPRIVSSRFALRIMNHFDHDIGGLKSTNWAGRSFNTNLLNELTQEQCFETVAFIQTQLNNTAIRGCGQAAP